MTCGTAPTLGGLSPRQSNRDRLAVLPDLRLRRFTAVPLIADQTVGDVVLVNVALAPCPQERRARRDDVFRLSDQG